MAMLTLCPGGLGNSMDNIHYVYVPSVQQVAAVTSTAPSGQTQCSGTDVWSPGMVTEPQGEDPVIAPIEDQLLQE